MEILKELYIIRHGQTEHNAKGIVQGKGVNLPLNELGQQQAKQFFEAYKNVHFDKLYASSLLRAQQSIQLFEQLGNAIEVSSNLDEISWGNMEGENFTNENDSSFKQMLQSWQQGNIHAKFQGGESPYDLQQRQKLFLQKMIARPHKKILIATHGRFLRAFMCTLTGVDLSQMEKFHHENLCLYKVNYYANNSFKIELSCSTQHLES